MKGNEFLDKMELVDAAFIEDADKLPAKKKPVWAKWGAVAACVCLVAVGVFGAMSGGLFGTSDEIPPVVPGNEEAEAFGFTLSDNEQTVYFPISFEERRTYGLVDTDAVGLTKENTYEITEKDLGELMGTVAACGDETLVGCKVYHFAKYPEFDSICIVETPSGYAFYTTEWLNIEVPIGQSSDLLLDAYDLPESLQKMEVLSHDFTYLFTVEDDAICNDILKMLEGRENSGLEANEQRFAQAWYDAFDNEDVYYSEEDGCVRFKQMQSNTQDNTITYTDEEGNTIVQNASSPDSTLYDQAHNLWSTGERLIRITTNRGFQFEIDYFPSINTFIWGNGYFEISKEDTVALNTLLQIE